MPAILRAIRRLLLSFLAFLVRDENLNIAVVCVTASLKRSHSRLSPMFPRQCGTYLRKEKRFKKGYGRIVVLRELVGSAGLPAR